MTSLTLGNSRIEIALSRDRDALLAYSVANRATGFNWVAPGTNVGPCLSQGDRLFAGMHPTNGFTLTGPRRERTESGGEALNVTWARPDGLELDWTLMGFPEVGVVEYTAKVTNKGTEILSGLTRLGPLSIRLRGETERCRLHWVTRNDYRKHEVMLDGAFTLKGGGWNSPDAVGWLALERADIHEILFLGIEWESNWRVSLERDGSDFILTCALENFQRDLPPNASMTSPRVFLGVSHGDLDDALRDMHDYLQRYVMPPKLLHAPWVTYDIWGTEAQGVEAGILAEIPFAADLGVDLFYVDAGWYEGSCKNGSGDWFTGVGNWQNEDRVKYPQGLASLSRQVHEAGMKFGLWFCPQMCDSGLVGRLIPDAWIARRDGQDIALNLGNGWATVTQICLGNPDVVRYLTTVLSSAVERYELDWLKWDDSGLPGPVCNRADHGHGAEDGPLVALTGKYEIWASLHERHPDLALENCGYPARLDYGLARYARAHWLSDDTSNALRCRQSQIHGSYVMPGAYNTAWIVKGEELHETDPDILDTVVRSRMIGLFGMGTLLGTLPERVSLYPQAVRDALKRNIAHYKQYRHLLYEDVYHLLPPSTGSDQWDAIQFCARAGEEAVVIVFRGINPQVERKLPLRGLTSDANYTVISLNTGHAESFSGATLTAEGLNVALLKPDASEIFLLNRR